MLQFTALSARFFGVTTWGHIQPWAARAVQSVEILWPSGTVQRFFHVPANQILIVEEASQ